MARLEDRGFIKSVERGKYLLLGFEPERVLSNPFFIASRIVYPSYVSFWSALNFYGFTEQVPVVVFLASLIAEEEKAVVDSLYLPENAGGLVEVAKAVYNAKDKVDLDKLFSYAAAMKSKSLCSRLGYLLERFGSDTAMLLESSAYEYVKLDPTREKSRVWDKKWHVNVNLSEEEILGWSKDLMPLLSVVVPYEVAAKRVGDGLRHQAIP
ncbi:transcriptional regulator, trmB [groundwater metagenome]